MSGDIWTPDSGDLIEEISHPAGKVVFFYGKGGRAKQQDVIGWQQTNDSTLIIAAADGVSNNCEGVPFKDSAAMARLAVEDTITDFIMASIQGGRIDPAEIAHTAINSLITEVRKDIEGATTLFTVVIYPDGQMKMHRIGDPQISINGKPVSPGKYPDLIPQNRRNLDLLHWFEENRETRPSEAKILQLWKGRASLPPGRKNGICCILPTDITGDYPLSKSVTIDTNRGDRIVGGSDGLRMGSKNLRERTAMAEATRSTSPLACAETIVQILKTANGDNFSGFVFFRD